MLGSLTGTGRGPRRRRPGRPPRPEPGARRHVSSGTGGRGPDAPRRAREDAAPTGPGANPALGNGFEARLRRGFVETRSRRSTVSPKHGLAETRSRRSTVSPKHGLGETRSRRNSVSPKLGLTETRSRRNTVSLKHGLAGTRLRRASQTRRGRRACGALLRETSPNPAESRGPWTPWRCSGSRWRRIDSAGRRQKRGVADARRAVTRGRPGHASACRPPIREANRPDTNRRPGAAARRARRAGRSNPANATRRRDGDVTRITGSLAELPNGRARRRVRRRRRRRVGKGRSGGLVTVHRTDFTTGKADRAATGPRKPPCASRHPHNRSRACRGCRSLPSRSRRDCRRRPFTGAPAGRTARRSRRSRASRGPDSRRRLRRAGLAARQSRSGPALATQRRRRA